MFFNQKSEHYIFILNGICKRKIHVTDHHILFFGEGYSIPYNEANVETTADAA